MARSLKTSKKKRTSYIYYTAEGLKIVIKPGENGVTETDIELLHMMDDSEVDEQRRYDYRVSENYDADHDGANEAVHDRNWFLADNSTNPETVYIENEDLQTQNALIKKLSEATELLLPQQKTLVKKVYLDRRTMTDIAAEEGVTEAAIRNRLKKIHQKLGKTFF